MPSVSAKYRLKAAGYDATTHRTAHIRRRAIALLNLAAGGTVVDVGCGTGLSFPHILQSIGPGGRLIGVDASDAMLTVARERIDAAGWRNVTLVHAPAETARLPGDPADAFLFHFAHDVLRSERALDNLLAHAKPGARVAAAGMKFFPWWLAPANLYILLAARPYVTTMKGFSRPWSLLDDRLDHFAVRPALFGSCFVGAGACQPGPGSRDR